VAEKFKEVTVALSVDQIAWLDKQAFQLRVSRAAYIRTIFSLLQQNRSLDGFIKNS